MYGEKGNYLIIMLNKIFQLFFNAKSIKRNNYFNVERNKKFSFINKQCRNEKRKKFTTLKTFVIVVKKKCYSQTYVMCHINYIAYRKLCVGAVKMIYEHVLIDFLHLAYSINYNLYLHNLI